MSIDTTKIHNKVTDIKADSVWVATDGSPTFVTVTRVDEDENEVYYKADGETLIRSKDAFPFSVRYANVPPLPVAKQGNLMLTNAEVDMKKLEGVAKNLPKNVITFGKENKAVLVSYGNLGGTQIDTARWIRDEISPCLKKDIAIEIKASERKGNLILSYSKAPTLER